ncbi:MAG TPA: AMP-binding protein, partial [Sphingomicrobium sp.]
MESAGRNSFVRQKPQYFDTFYKSVYIRRTITRMGSRRAIRRGPDKGGKMAGMGNPETWSQGQQDTVIAALDRAVAAHPERVLFDFGGELTTYGEFDQLSTRLAHSLAALGLKPGETIVTMLDNNIDAVTGWIAANKLCAVSVPVNTALRGEFLRHQIADARGHIVICEADYVERIAQVADGLPELTLILYRGMLSSRPACPVRIASLDEYRGQCGDAIAVKPAPSDLACIVYTSGTTGPSKGCMLSYNYKCN